MSYKNVDLPETSSRVWITCVKGLVVRCEEKVQEMKWGFLCVERSSLMLAGAMLFQVKRRLLKNDF